jgi:hypothetical protein
MTKDLRWRLSQLPTGGEIADLVEQGVITKDEAREILFSTPDKQDEDKVSDLKAEIKFLKEVIGQLTKTSTTFVTVPGTYYRYNTQPWFTGYVTAGAIQYSATTNTSNALSVNTASIH